jgi:hypothetical protein
MRRIAGLSFLAMTLSMVGCGGPLAAAAPPGAAAGETASELSHERYVTAADQVRPESLAAQNREAARPRR